MTRISWLKVGDIDDLADGDVVRLGNWEGAQQYKVAYEELKSGPMRGEMGVRLKDIEDWSQNIHYYAGARALIEAGLIWRQVENEVFPLDIWGTRTQVWQYVMGGWISLVDRVTPVQLIPENAELIWRMDRSVEGSS